LEVRPRIQHLRHTPVSWLIAQGVQLPAIPRRLGRESITTTIDRYGHLLPELDDGLVRALAVGDGGLGGSGPRARQRSSAPGSTGRHMDRGLVGYCNGGSVPGG
jgi:hypothetical protein